MTAKLTLFAPGPLLATADPRVKSGLLLPFGEPGLTNMGKVHASAGALTLRSSPDPLTLEHVPNLGVADFIMFEERADGLYCSVSYRNTRLGDAALAEYEDGTRTGLSVEIEQPVIRAGQLVAGEVSGGSQVETPAFTSAKLAASELAPAADVGADPAESRGPAEGVPQVIIDGDPLENVQSVDVAPDAVTITTQQTDPATGDGGTAGLAASKQTKQKDEPMTVQTPEHLKASAGAKLSTLYARLAQAAGARGDLSKLTAALSDIVPGDILGIEQPQYVGELWSGKAFTRRIVPLFNHADLSSFNVQGWRWVTKPEVDDYAGNKTPVPSNEVETEPVETEAYRLAGAHDIDRKFRDFGMTEFWDAYYRAMTESVARKSDAKVRTLVAAEATRLHLAAAGKPAGVPTALWLIVKGISRSLDTLEVLPDHALVTTDLWEEIMFTRAEDVLTYLDAAMGFEEGSLAARKFQILPVPTGSLTVDLATDFVGKVLVSSRDAVTVHELGGDAPIRVEAPNIANGGIDSGVFYYGAVNVHAADGLTLYDAPA